MKRSYFSSRIISLLIIALALWALLTSLIYGFIARPAFVRMKSTDLMPQARWISTQVSENGVSGDQQLTNLVTVSYSFFNVWTFIALENGELYHTPLPDTLAKQRREDILNEIREISRKTVSDPKEYSSISTQTLFPGEVLYVSAPILIKNADGKLCCKGTVVMAQALSELYAGAKSLNIALLISSLIIGILLLFPGVVAIQHLIKPLNEIRRVSLNLSRSDFSLRADESDESELGDLAHCINYMADRLEESMSQLKIERNQLRQIIDGISEGILAIDAEGNVTQINARLWKLFQLSPQAISPERLLQQESISRLFKRCLEESDEVTETLNVDRKRIQCTINPLIDDIQRPSGAVALFRDVTEAIHLDQTRRDYVANVSHELRTPVTAMRALLEPLADGMVKDEKDKHRYYGILLRETLRLSRLIDDMLELSRLQSGKSAITQGPIDFNELVGELADNFSLQASDHNIKFNCEICGRHIPAIWGNRDRVQQILIIFFDNALKFTPENGLITFGVSTDEHSIEVFIKDTGPGIKPEDLPYVFERFYKADKAHNEVGTGLGLSIAKEIADQLDMVLAVSSAAGEGARFSLRVRFAKEVLRSQKHFKDVYDTDEKEIN